MLLADVALCSLPGLHPGRFLAHRNLFLCKLKYIQKLNTTLLGACTGITFTDSMISQVFSDLLHIRREMGSDGRLAQLF